MKVVELSELHALWSLHFHNYFDVSGKLKQERKKNKQQLLRQVNIS
jgi:hypothetical protein